MGFNIVKSGVNLNVNIKKVAPGVNGYQKIDPQKDQLNEIYNKYIGPKI